MACCGFSCEYIYARLDAAENNKTGVMFHFSRDLLICDVEPDKNETQEDPVEA